MQKFYRNYKDGISGEVDDGWWETLLKEEEKYVDVSQMIEKIPIEPQPKKSDLNQDDTDWNEINQLKESEDTVTCVVLGFNRGGLLVDGKCFHGFVPISHLIEMPMNMDNFEVEPCLAPYIGRRITLKIIESDQERGRIVLSERAARTRPGERNKLLKSIVKGDEVGGVVTNVTDFGVFIDLGGIEGLIHISELSWGRVNHPSDVLEVSEEVVVLVLQVDSGKGRVALSLKQLLPNPWNDATNKFQPGDLVDAIVTDIVKFGVFARLEDGLEGLIHVSQMGSRGHIRPADIVCKGQQIKARILQIIPEKQRMSMKLEIASVSEDEYSDFLD